MLEYMEQYCTSLRQDADGVYVAVLKPEYAVEGYRVVKCDNITGDIKTDRWVTINGAHVLISDRTNRIIGGMGGKFNGMRVGKYGSTFSEYRNAKKVNGKRLLKYKGNAGNTKTVVTTKAGAKAMAKAAGDKNEARVQRVTALGKVRKTAVSSKKNLQQLNKLRDNYGKAVTAAKDKYTKKALEAGDGVGLIYSITDTHTRRERDEKYQSAMQMLTSDRLLKKYQAEYEEYLKHSSASEQRKDRQRVREINEQYKNADKIKENEAKKIYGQLKREIRSLDKEIDADMQKKDILRKKINWGTRNYNSLPDEKKKLLEEFKREKKDIEKKISANFDKREKAHNKSRTIYTDKAMEVDYWRFELRQEKNKLGPGIKENINAEKQRLRENKRIARRLTAFYNEMNRLEKNYDDRTNRANEKLNKLGYTAHQKYARDRKTLLENLKTVKSANKLNVTPEQKRELLAHLRKINTNPEYAKQVNVPGTKANKLNNEIIGYEYMADYVRYPNRD